MYRRSTKDWKPCRSIRHTAVWARPFAGITAPPRQSSLGFRSSPKVRGKLRMSPSFIIESRWKGQRNRRIERISPFGNKRRKHSTITASVTRSRTTGCWIRQGHCTFNVSSGIDDTQTTCTTRTVARSHKTLGNISTCSFRVRAVYLGLWRA